ncbi:putative short chain dehydrogenase/reductase [Mycena epipterygia]|nr:putative short chain dehydrogenase/reductase [Mycena epipterygia]
MNGQSKKGRVRRPNKEGSECYFIRPSQLQRYCHSQSGSWALVTGASDGIGRAFADELLASGFNVLIHGRNERKLIGIKQELERRFPRRAVDYVVADASEHDYPERAIVEKVQRLPGKLTVLVNNVGGVEKPFTLLAESPAAVVETCLNVNSRFPTQLTRALLPTMKRDSPALIINCGSLAGSAGLPYLAAYSGTKAFIFAFTQALKHEMVLDGVQIEVMGVSIANVQSGSNKVPLSFGTISSAQGVLGKVGSGETLTYAHWSHALMITGALSLPEWLQGRIIQKEMGLFYRQQKAL